MDKKAAKVVVGLALASGLTLLLLTLLKKGRPSPCPPIGDLDGDGYITLADIDLMEKYIMGIITLPDWRLADVDGDGEVNMGDVQVMERYIGGAIDTFPACGVY